MLVKRLRGSSPINSQFFAYQNCMVMQIPSGGQPTMLPALLLAWATFCCLCDSLEGSEGTPSTPPPPFPS